MKKQINNNNQSFTILWPISPFSFLRPFFRAIFMQFLDLIAHGNYCSCDLLAILLQWLLLGACQTNYSRFGARSRQTNIDLRSVGLLMKPIRYTIHLVS